MKNSIKLILSSLLLLLTAACVDIAVGQPANPDSPYVAKNGYVEAAFDRSYDSCWQITEEFVNSIDGTLKYHSQSEGVIDIELAAGGTAYFKVEKVTNRATKVSVRSYKFAYPRNDIASAYFEPLAEKLK